jgi:hypothetical protein
LVTFFAAMAALLAGGAAPVPAWFGAAAAGALVSVALHRLPAFRSLADHGVKRGTRVHYPLAALSAALSFAIYVGLLRLAPETPLAVAVAAQGVGVLSMAALQVKWVRMRLWPRQAVATDISGLGRQLNAQVACWVELSDGRIVEPNGWSSVVSADLVERSAGERQPVLVIQAPSPRPQRRVNLERSSALLIPRMTADGTPEAVAVIARRDRRPFEARDLEEAMAWMERRGGAA